MFSSSIQLFGRNFVVGYFLPTALFVTASALLFLLFMPQAALDATELAEQLQSVWTVSAAVFGTWALSILLMLLNRGLIRALEGYGFLAKTPFRTWQLRRFDRLQKEITETTEQYKVEVREQGQVSPQAEERYAKLLLKRREDFPMERKHVLAASFGNVIRAFETYSRAMYGLDAIPAWPRIIAVVPDDFRETLNSAKAQVDFAVNTVYLALIVAIQYVAYAVTTRSAPMTWIPLVALAVTFLAYRFAVSSAREWGEHVKAVFDLYRHALLKQMGLEIPESWEDERQCWQEISRSFLYGYQLDLPRNPRRGSKGE
jgi:hypothetical protein